MNQRHHQRHALNLTATISHAGKSYSAAVQDISVGGIRVSIPNGQIPAKSEISLTLAHFDILKAKVIWQKDTRIGVQFLTKPDGIEEFIYNLATYGALNQVNQSLSKSI